MNETMVHEDFAIRTRKVMEFAQQLYSRNPDWVEFFREVLGISGAARTLFRNEEFVSFEQTTEYAAIQQMVANLRNRRSSANNGTGNEPTRVITVRLPESVHEALKVEAADHNTSMNKLCIAKLLQVLVEPEANRSSGPTESESSATRPSFADPVTSRNPSFTPPSTSPDSQATIRPNPMAAGSIPPSSRF